MIFTGASWPRRRLSAPTSGRARRGVARDAAGFCARPSAPLTVSRCISFAARSRLPPMALSFGVTVLPDPPHTRFLELIELAEEQGFDYGWTYDSHVLWHEATPLLTLAVDRTSRMKLGHFVTNPGTREPTVLASAYATLHVISGGRMVMGIGRGDSARRVIGQQPVKMAEFEDACKMIKKLMNGEEV